MPSSGTLVEHRPAPQQADPRPRGRPAARSSRVGSRPPPGRGPPDHRPGSELVAQVSQQPVPGGHVRVRLHADRGQAVDDPGDTAPSTSDGDQDLYRVGRGTEHRAHLRHRLDLVHNADREALPQHDHECVTGPDRLRVPNGEAGQVGVITGPADQPGARGLAEGDAEPQVRAHPGQRLMQVLHRLDEVRLADNDVTSSGLSIGTVSNETAIAAIVHLFVHPTRHGNGKTLTPRAGLRRGRHRPSDLRPCVARPGDTCGASHSSVQASGLTCSDQRHPGSRTARPISLPPMCTSRSCPGEFADLVGLGEILLRCGGHVPRPGWLAGRHAGHRDHRCCRGGGTGASGHRSTGNTCWCGCPAARSCRPQPGSCRPPGPRIPRVTERSRNNYFP